MPSQPVWRANQILGGNRLKIRKARISPGFFLSKIQKVQLNSLTG